MSPAPVAEYVDSQRDRLQEQRCVQVLVPEHQEEGRGVEIAHPEVIFAVASGQEHAGKAQDRSDQVYEQNRLVSGYGKESVIYPIHHIVILPSPPGRAREVSVPRPRTP